MSNSVENPPEWFAIIVGFIAEIVAAVVSSFILGFIDTSKISPLHFVTIVAFSLMLVSGIVISAFWSRIKTTGWLKVVGLLAVGVVVLTAGSGYFYIESINKRPLLPEEVALTEVARETQVAATREALLLIATQSAGATSTQQLINLQGTASAQLLATQLWEQAKAAAIAGATETQQAIDGTIVANSTVTARNTQSAQATETQAAINRANAALATAQVAVQETRSAESTQTQIAVLATPNPAIPQGNCSKDVKPPCSYIVQDGDNYTLIAYNVYGNYDDATTIINYNRNDKGRIVILQPNDVLFLPSLSALPPLPYPHCKVGGGFPCQHIGRQGDTFDIVAQEFYGSVSFSKFLDDENEIYPLSETQIKNGTIPADSIVVLPIPPSP